MNANSLKEKYLVYKVRLSKDADAYGQLYDIYVDRIFRFIYFKVSSKEEAEDITSEVFLKTWEYLGGNGKDVKHFSALIYRVARNCVIDFYRSKNSQYRPTDEEQMEMIEDKRDIEEDTNISLEFENIEKQLDKLKDIYKEALVLKYIEEFSVSEIAEIMNKSKANIRVLLHRATRALKDLRGE